MIRFPHGRPSEIDKLVKIANKKRIKCPICGKNDNDWPERRGLCIYCYCNATLKIGKDAFENIPQEKLISKIKLIIN